MKGYAVLAVCGWMLLGGWMLRGLSGPDVLSQAPPEEKEVVVCGNSSYSLGGNSQYAAPPGGPDGKAIFQANCAACHNPIKDATGPALQGADGRVPSKEWLYEWIHNPAAKIASGDAYANKLYDDWGKTQMTAFPDLTEAEIDAVIAYVNIN